MQRSIITILLMAVVSQYNIIASVSNSTNDSDNQTGISMSESNNSRHRITQSKSGKILTDNGLLTVTMINGILIISVPQGDAVSIIDNASEKEFDLHYGIHTLNVSTDPTKLTISINEVQNITIVFLP